MTGSTMITAADLKKIGWHSDGALLLPPTDVAGGGFSCCASCAAAPIELRCPGCPRERPAFSQSPETKRSPRRRWLWRREKD